MAHIPATRDGAQTPGVGAGTSTGGREQGLIGLLTSIVSRNVRHVPAFVAKNFIWLGVLSALWLFLMSYPTYKLPAIGSLLVFLTAAYNNFIAKALYIGAINTAVIPLIQKVREDGAKDLVERYLRTAKTIARAFALLGAKGAAATLLLYGGIGIAASNALTRNNGMDKYFICVVVAFWLLDSVSQGLGNMIVRLYRAAHYDIYKRGVSYETIYAAFAATTAGLLLGFLPGMIGSRSYWDYKGYIMGALCIAASVGLNMAGNKDAKASS